MQKVFASTHVFSLRTFGMYYMFYFIWLNFLSVGILDMSFQSTGTGKYAKPTRHLNHVRYEHFPQWNQRQLDFLLIKRNSTLQFFSEKFHLSYFWKMICQQPLCNLFKSSWHMLPHTVHVTILVRTLKICRSTWQNDLWCHRCVYHITVYLNEVRTRLSIVVRTLQA